MSFPPKGKRAERSRQPIGESRRLPQAIRTNGGPDFTGWALQRWADERGVELKLIEARMPTQNTYVESFSRKFGASSS